MVRSLPPHSSLSLSFLSSHLCCAKGRARMDTAGNQRVGSEISSSYVRGNPFFNTLTHRQAGAIPLMDSDSCSDSAEISLSSGGSGSDGGGGAGGGGSGAIEQGWLEYRLKKKKWKRCVCAVDLPLSLPICYCCLFGNGACVRPQPSLFIVVVVVVGSSPSPPYLL